MYKNLGHVGHRWSDFSVPFGYATMASHGERSIRDETQVRQLKNREREQRTSQSSARDHMK